MIGMLVGQVASVDARTALIVVSDVGYETYMPSQDLSSLHEGQEVRVYTSMQVSQDSITLYAFTTQAAKRMFLQVQKVSGIGPKVALSILSTLNVDRLLKAISEGDVTALSSAPGLGKKGAQKIILELKGSIDLNSLSADVSDASSGKTIDTGISAVIDGLVSLGWRQSDAQKAVEQVCAENNIVAPVTEADMPNVLRMALTLLDRGR
ncbi:Holliday junction ATP-dependent DNA helicase RuvA [Gardnerella vaginalis]|uniref:Holliday junction branch migration complex subunit RuvA n=1 Tax=Gardnerella vaginalis TaxID=2702 RepID=A0A3E1IPN9_GARVA|nr:Holliday junction branch migration protein RuvA [Gardnerella vaginalis]MBF9307949.1 Holliday junction branch migration protein RuvA [Bifidobacteriaceae bacterium NR043]MBF9353385.1 Holliday junction branch migration protein RuvA [Bifidobacteriaceae bacterium NR044]RFD74975.1 Holliday junction ATP-dependent DNA helicase RuvA [Gardnerella vaginalis]RFT41271.1 Holliday junction branch migration protein RuvA [Bifidobacteriaceae bacterium NR003]